MISSKILAQSAAAGLMAGAILAMPLFVFGPEDNSKNRACPYSSNKVVVDLEDRTAQFDPPMLRSAPAPSQMVRGQAEQPQIKEQPHEKSLRELREYRRSLAERNRAADAALEEINYAYERSNAHQLGAEAAHSVRLEVVGRK